MDEEFDDCQTEGRIAELQRAVDTAAGDYRAFQHEANNRIRRLRTQIVRQDRKIGELEARLADRGGVNHGG